MIECPVCANETRKPDLKWIVQMEDSATTYYKTSWRWRQVCKPCAVLHALAGGFVWSKGKKFTGESAWEPNR